MSGPRLSAALLDEAARTFAADENKHNRKLLQVCAVAFARNRASEIAAALGARGGSVSSDAKTVTSRANGRKGGRPRKQTDE